MQWWFEHQRDVIRFEFFGTFLLSTVVHCHCDDTTLHGLQVFTILIGNAMRMMRFKGRQEGEEFHVEMRRVVVKRGREAGRQQGQWSRRGGPANRQTNISLWTQRSISLRRREIFSRSRPRNYISQHPLWQGRSQTLRPGVVDILQTVEHFSSSFDSDIVVTTQYFGIMFKTC